MTDAQRRYYLRQQLKAIQEELGESEGKENEDLLRRIEKANLPEHVKTAALREVDRLARMPQASPEYQMVRTYIDWVLEVPWIVTMTEDRLDPVEARRALDEDHYDLDKVKERIVEYLAVRKLKGDMKGPILCFVGPAGRGQDVARPVDRARHEPEVRPHLARRRARRGRDPRATAGPTSASMPGRIIQAMKQAGSTNPVFMLDEIDKVERRGFPGDPAAALLEVLDPAQNNSFRDHYLEVDLDLSRVLFIATANQLGTIHPRPARPHGDHHAGRLHRGGEAAHRAALPAAAPADRARPAGRGDRHRRRWRLQRIIAEYTREAGVRNLERQLGPSAARSLPRVASRARAGEWTPHAEGRSSLATVDAG